MVKIMISITCLLLLTGCSKDKTPLPCTGISMTGERELFVGKWRWYSTVVEEWFDVGVPIYHDYTPQNQGFEYYFTLSKDGEYKGYRNDTLIHDFLITGNPEENFNGSTVDYFKTSINCGNDEIEFRRWVWYDTQDTIFMFKYPFNFRDEANQLESKLNYFVKE